MGIQSFCSRLRVKKFLTPIVCIFILVAMIKDTSAAHVSSQGALDLVKAGTSVVRTLNQICPDSFCCGDYFYRWQTFEYDEEHRWWKLNFFLIPYKSNSETKQFEIPKRHFQGNITIEDAGFLKGACTIHAPEPFSIFDTKADGTVIVTKISESLRTAIINCTRDVEDFHKSRRR